MSKQLIDDFGRTVDYVRISVTDRCDFRCVYCMAEEMTFLPRAEIMSIEEIELLAKAFTELGVQRIRLTGGEPLVRRGLLDRLGNIGNLPGLNELLMTTNGSQLVRYSKILKKAGVKRLNISLDSLRPERFKAMTRNGDLQKVLAGIDAAIEQGFQRIKINAVVMKGSNEDEVLDLLEFARDKQIDIAFIEEMPLGNIDSHDRALSFCSSDEVRAIIESRHELHAMVHQTAGPSRYFRMADSPTRVGFISPHSHNFCADCNRVRVTASGRLLLCLGNEHGVDLLPIMRAYKGQIKPLKEAIIAAMPQKPEKHHFDLEAEPQILRFMNTTGG
ncbi:MAG TPA: GTP 3',8-cyclase MoaA [Oceanospirillaceae bacterium]|jgi:cyclic pyranopterin phosphate synthase|nr:GTP 3',8-cyclase MoaA [Oceanospirillaceae bacterium]